MMSTILKGFAMIMVISLLTFLFIKIFSVKVLVGLYLTVLFLVACYFFGLLVEDVWD